MSTGDPAVAKSKFSVGQQIRRRSSPDQLGYVVKPPQRLGGEWWYPVFFGSQRAVNVPESDIEEFSARRTVEDLFNEAVYGSKESFSKLMTFTKLQFPLRNNLYSFRSTRTEFKSYQFKPLLKFLDSQKQRLLIADEVGLGKTIESGLIISELRARHPDSLDRILIVCPSALCLKWQMEMRNRFDEKFDILDSRGLRRFLQLFQTEGDSVKLRGICSLQSVRSKDVIEEWEAAAPPLDLLVIDEAHHLRNPETLSHRIGRLLGDNSDGMLLLTATPIHLGNLNLFYLLRLLDPEVFGTDPTLLRDKLGETLFDQMIRANEPVVDALRELRAKYPPDLGQCAAILRRVESGPRSSLFTANPEYGETVKRLANTTQISRTDVIALQRRVTNLNQLSQVFTRTRKRDVESRSLRQARTVTVNWTAQEQAIYDAVTERITHLHQSDKVFAMFLAMTPQRQMASCIPAAASRYETPGSALVGTLDEEETDLQAEDWPQEQSPTSETTLDISQAIHAWRGAGSPDTKFEALLEIFRLVDAVEPNGKVLVFAYFKGTLEHLKTKLRQRGLGVEVISGDYDRETRQERMDRFKTDPKLRILLSSEVGSEGLDFQFCHILVNYDLPWNPMVVEQRIGRLDRIGQMSDKVSIFNLSIPGTVEDRILSRLYTRIQIFEKSIGDLEPIIGEEIQRLTSDLFRSQLTTAEQEARIRQAADALENRRQEMEDLEKASSKFIAADEFFEDEIGRVQQKKRYISGVELETFLEEFLKDRFPECALENDGNGYFQLHLTSKLEYFVKVRTRTEDPAWFEFIRKSSGGILRFTFDSEIALRNREIDFLTVQHPLIRAIKQYYEENAEQLHPVAKLSVRTSLVEPGDYFYFIYRLEFSGARKEHVLVPIFVSADADSILSAELSEELLTHLITESQTLDLLPTYECNQSYLATATSYFSEYLQQQRQDLAKFNEALVQSRLASLRQSYDARIARKQQLLKEGQSRNSPTKYLRMLEGTLRRLNSEFHERLEQAEKEAKLEITYDHIAAGIINVHREAGLS